eukprot:TRINITY_DN22190_c0_g1_i1.p1 TRINITY_DN22190_c0_g1~~TRINITY_DN22190_c0_g1_i1.p1  ORF type:complete len:240 (+),score=33.74 TRINITY_DN22190_c0_g1_i1:74-793(+)
MMQHGADLEMNSALSLSDCDVDQCKVFRQKVADWLARNDGGRTSLPHNLQSSTNFRVVRPAQVREYILQQVATLLDLNPTLSEHARNTFLADLQKIVLSFMQAIASCSEVASRVGSVDIGGKTGGRYFKVFFTLFQHRLSDGGIIMMFSYCAFQANLAGQRDNPAEMNGLKKVLYYKLMTNIFAELCSVLPQQECDRESALSSPRARSLSPPSPRLVQRPLGRKVSFCMENVEVATVMV